MPGAEDGPHGWAPWITGGGPGKGSGRIYAGGRVVDPRDDWYTLCVRSGLGQLVPAKRKHGKDYKRYVRLDLHDFRRGAIRNMTHRGVGNKTAMRTSGDKTFSVFQRYNIVDEADLITLPIDRERTPDTSGAN